MAKGTKSFFFDFQSPTGQSLYQEGLDIVDIIDGGVGNDRIWGHGGKDIIRGNNGNDSIHGGAGNDRLIGGEGADKITAGKDADAIYLFDKSQDRDIVFFNKGDSGTQTGTRDKLYGFETSEDKIDLSLFGLSFDYKDGAHVGGGQASVGHVAGFLSIDYNGDGVSDMQIQSDKQINSHDFTHSSNVFNRVIGDDKNNVLISTSAREIFEGGKGADIIKLSASRGDADIVILRSGDSAGTIVGQDRIFNFKSGEDKIDLSSFGTHFGWGGEALIGGGQPSVVYKGDTLYIDHDGNGTTAIQVLMRNANLTLNDFTKESNVINRIAGTSDANIIRDTNGRNILEGGKGQDTIIFSTIEGDADILVFSKSDIEPNLLIDDIIYNFKSGEDKIHLMGFGSDLKWMDQAAPVGGGTPSFAFDGGHLYIDADGNGEAEVNISMQNTNELSFDDFIF